MSETTESRAVLIADTRWENYERVLEATQRLQVDLYWGTTPAEAAQLLENVSIQVVVTDPTMVGPGGAPLFEELKRHDHWRTLYTILMTEIEGIPERLEILERGADDLLVKPVNPWLLTARILVGLRMRRLMAELRALEQRQAVTATVLTIAHEINNPLTAIMGNTVMMRDEIERIHAREPNPFLVEAAETIERESQRIAEAVARLRALRNPTVARVDRRFAVVKERE